jgi:hypothetical protein
MNLQQLWAVVKESTRASKANQLAVGVVGVGAATAAVIAANRSVKVAVFGTLIMFCFMTLLLVLGWAKTYGAREHRPLILTFLWTVLAAFVAVVLLMVSTFAFGVPEHATKVIYGVASRPTPQPSPQPNPDPVPSPRPPAKMKVSFGIQRVMADRKQNGIAEQAFTFNVSPAESELAECAAWIKESIRAAYPANQSPRRASVERRSLFSDVVLTPPLVSRKVDWVRWIQGNGGKDFRVLSPGDRVAAAPGGPWALSFCYPGVSPAVFYFDGTGQPVAPNSTDLSKDAFYVALESAAPSRFDAGLLTPFFPPGRDDYVIREQSHLEALRKGLSAAGTDPYYGKQQLLKEHRIDFVVRATPVGGEPGSP